MIYILEMHVARHLAKTCAAALRSSPRITHVVQGVGLHVTGCPARVSAVTGTTGVAGTVGLQHIHLLSTQKQQATATPGGVESAVLVSRTTGFGATPTGSQARFSRRDAFQSGLLFRRNTTTSAAQVGSPYATQPDPTAYARSGVSVPASNDSTFVLDLQFLQNIKNAEIEATKDPENSAAVARYFELLFQQFPLTLVNAYESWPVPPPKSTEPLYLRAKTIAQASAEAFIARMENQPAPNLNPHDMHPNFINVYGIPVPVELVPSYPPSPTLAALQHHQPSLVMPDGTAFYVVQPPSAGTAAANAAAESIKKQTQEAQDGSTPTADDEVSTTTASQSTEASRIQPKSHVPPYVMFVVHPPNRLIPGQLPPIGHPASFQGVPPQASPGQSAADLEANQYQQPQQPQQPQLDQPHQQQQAAPQFAQQYAYPYQYPYPYPPYIPYSQPNANANNGEPLKVTVVTSTGERIGRFVMNLLFLGATIGLLVWFSEKRGAGGIINTEGHSEFNPEMITETLDDVKGCDEARDEARELVDYLRDPAKYRRLGGEAPKGILMSGPPGTGKTLLARAIAGEAEVPFYYATGSSFEEVFVGVGSRRIRNLFQQARATAPCIIFIDEIDALGRERKNSLTETSRATLNALLAEMDGFEKTSGIVVIAATNFPESLDAALRRPGRFDRNVHVDLPDMKGRKDILDLYVSKIAAGPDIDTKRLAKSTSGASGAMLKTIVNTAALRAAQLNKPYVTQDDLEFAQDKIIMGAAKTSTLIPEKTKRLTAYHEGGHALLALKTPGAMPIYKATILPRGSALGYVAQVPDEDVHSQTLTELLARMDVAMGGRAAEEFISGKENVTTGASSDFHQVTRIARKFVTEFGMSDVVGKLYIENPEKLSEEMQRKIDLEVKRVVDESYQRALNCLKQHEADLHKIANGLLKYETLTLEEIQKILRGEELERDS